MRSTGSGSPKQYRSVVEGFELVADFRRSGLSAGDFARERSVSRKSLNYWVGRSTALAHAAVTAPRGFVDVTPRSIQPGLPAPVASQSGSLEIRLQGGATIVVGAGFDGALLRCVVQALSC
ncbi:MAG: hypothetical protein H0X45_11445 [Planctomycetes bacterium]|nr:hypothetical protein [Planctomycetota bacterium]